MPNNDYKLTDLPNTDISENGKLVQNWKIWFNDVYKMIGSPNNYYNDTWSPVLSGLTGTATITDAKYFKFRRSLNFSLTIVPTGATTSVLGTTKLTLPVRSIGYGSCNVFNVTTRVLLGTGFIDMGYTELYLPAWSGVSNHIAINGFVLVNG